MNNIDIDGLRAALRAYYDETDIWDGSDLAEWAEKFLSGLDNRP